MWEDNHQVEGHIVVFTPERRYVNFTSMVTASLKIITETIVKDECTDGSHCENIKTCSLRHPKICKRIILERTCGFGEKYAYNHKRKIST